MNVFGGKWPAACCAAGVSIAAIGGCINHDQLYLANPSPCHITCEPDHITLIDPECHGYHATYWMPWSCNCEHGGVLPPPFMNGGIQPPEYFEMPGSPPRESPIMESVPTPVPSPAVGPFPAPTPSSAPAIPNPVREIPAPAPNGTLPSGGVPGSSPELQSPNSAVDPRARPMGPEKGWAGRLFSFLGRSN